MSYFSVITLNVNGFNSLIKQTYRLADWIKKQGPSICCLQETHLTGKNSLRVKEWKKIF
jgi:exonuclease III